MGFVRACGLHEWKHWLKPDASESGLSRRRHGIRPFWRRPGCVENNADDDLTVSSNVSSTFGIPMSAGDFFFVTVLTQPSSPLPSCM